MRAEVCSELRAPIVSIPPVAAAPSRVIDSCLLIISTAFPQGSLWRERPPRGECLPCATVCAGKRSPVPHQRSKRGGRSLHFLSLSCGAISAGREAAAAGDSPACPCCLGRGKPLSHAGFQAQPGPQWRGLRPLIVHICNCQNRAPSACATPRLKGGHPYDGTALTPRGGNRRSFPRRWRLAFPAAISRFSP